MGMVYRLIVKFFKWLVGPDPEPKPKKRHTRNPGSSVRRTSKPRPSIPEGPRILKAGRSYSPPRSSKKAIKYSGIAIEWLEGEALRRDIEGQILHAENGGEFRIPGTRIAVDGFHVQTNTVFEFHGDAYHGNPKKYRPNECPSHFSNKTAAELYKATVLREKRIRDLGYTLVVMWEQDYKMQRNRFRKIGIED